MNHTRRRFLAAGVLAGLAVVFCRWTPAAQSRSARRLLIDEVLLPHAKRFPLSEPIIIATDQLMDSTFVRSLACGGYAAYLSPANELLLLDVCRDLRISTTSSSSFVLFDIEASHSV